MPPHYTAHSAQAAHGNYWSLFNYQRAVAAVASIARKTNFPVRPPIFTVDPLQLQSIAGESVVEEEDGGARK